MQHDQPDTRDLLAQLVDQMRIQTGLLGEIRLGVELDPCLLDKIARIACLTANEVHQHTLELRTMRQTLDTLVELYRTAHPEAALEVDRLATLRAELERCCPPEDEPELICHYEPCARDGGLERGSGSSSKARGVARPVEVSERDHRRWQIVDRPHHEDDDQLPVVARGSLFAQLTPSPPTPQVMKFMSGGGPMPGGQQPVTFRTFTGSERSGTWPPDMSGAKAGDVVVMSGNLWLKLSVDGGKTFSDLDFTKLFAADTTYGGWAGDQVVHYVPSIDCFVLYVQSYKGTGVTANKNVVKIALASPADLKTFSGGKAAWKRQWNFNSDDFGLGAAWMDFPDVSYGERVLHVNTNVFAGQTGKLFFELPLAELKAGGAVGYQYAFIPDTVSGEPSKRLTIGSPTQNILGDTNYWAAHVDNSTMRIYQSRVGDSDYTWRDRKIANWPMATNNDVFSRPPDFSDWVSEDHRIIGATRVGSQIWFAWTAATGDGGGGGFSFPHAHIQIAKFSLIEDFKLIEQVQIWNPDHAFAYASLTTNSDNEVGISLAWGGGDKYYGSHAVGILGDFVVWYGEASELTSLRQKRDDAGNLLTNPDGSPLMDTRWGDYVHVRLAHPDTRFFSAFGYAVLKDPAATPAEKMDFLYVEFGREPLPPMPGLH